MLGAFPCLTPTADNLTTTLPLCRCRGGRPPISENLRGGTDPPGLSASRSRRVCFCLPLSCYVGLFGHGIRQAACSVLMFTGAGVYFRLADFPGPDRYFTDSRMPQSLAFLNLPRRQRTPEKGRTALIWTARSSGGMPFPVPADAMGNHRTAPPVPGG